MTRTSSITFWFVLTIVASAALYHTSYQVQSLNRQLRITNNQIEAEQKNLHVLQAEWVFLASPQKLEKAAAKHLALKPANPQQVMTLATLVDRLPTREERLAGFKLDGVPLASVKTNLQPRVVAATNTTRTAAEQRSHINNRMVMAQNSGSTINLPNGGQLRFANSGREP